MREFEFQYPNGPLIEHDLLESTIAKLQGSLDIHRRDMETGWVWYQLPPFLDGEITLSVSLAFFEGVIREVKFAHLDDDLYGKSWNDWSEEREKLRAQNTASWFSKHGYSSGSFSWGQILAAFDPKGGFGSGGIRYKKS